MKRGIRLVAVLAVLAVLALLSAGCASWASTSTASPSPRAQDGAYVVSEQRVSPRIVDLTVWSPALGRRAIVRLLTPDGWDERRPGDKWPVLYLLVGSGGSPADWTDNTDVADIPALRDVLVVTPEAGDAGWYSNWWNHGNAGPPAWETFHLTEVRELLEQGYGAGDRRVIAGLSMGGLGALIYAARHPGMFRAAASYSGAVHPLLNPALTLQRAGDHGVTDPYPIWGDPVAQRPIWLSHDAVDLAPRLRGLPLFLSVGNGKAGPFDPPGVTDDLEPVLEQMNLDLAARLAQLGIPATTDFYGPGTHSWPYWDRELHRSLPLLLKALGTSRT